MNKTRPIVIGLLGGVASGKSTVASMLESLGAARLDADAIGHEALRDPQIKKQILDYFGEELLDRDGSIDRVRLGKRVFGRAHDLKVLADITHPWIGTTLLERLTALRSGGQYPVICLDVSLLLESGRYDDKIDLLVFVDTSEQERQRRSRNARGWSEDEVGKRESHQIALAQKKDRADIVLTNDGGMDDLRKQVEALWKRFVQPAS